MKQLFQRSHTTFDRLRQLIPMPMLLVTLALLLLACSPTPEPTPVATETPTPLPQRSSFNDNVQAMNQAQAALSEMEFGFAPLLLEDDTRILIETPDDQPLARLAYPRQPADPAAWTAGDSFILSYATRRVLLDLPQVDRVALGSFDLAAPLANLDDTVNHMAVWVTFVDHTQAVVDLSPLSTDFAAQHKAQTFLSDEAELAARFTAWRDGVSLQTLQPMRVVEEAGESYYILAQVLVHPDHYEFSLRAHLAQVADPMQPLRLVQGRLVTVQLDRLDFAQHQTEIAAAGVDAFAKNSTLFIRQGSDNPALNDVLEAQLPLLWHLITKLDHVPVNPADIVPATATPTVTPSPTPTPTPTATPKRAQPLITS